MRSLKEALFNKNNLDKYRTIKTITIKTDEYVLEFERKKDSVEIHCHTYWNTDIDAEILESEYDDFIAALKGVKGFEKDCIVCIRNYIMIIDVNDPDNTAQESYIDEKDNKKLIDYFEEII